MAKKLNRSIDWNTFVAEQNAQVEDAAFSMALGIRTDAEIDAETNEARLPCHETIKVAENIELEVLAAVQELCGEGTYQAVSELQIADIVAKRLDSYIRPASPESPFQAYQTMLDLITTGLTTAEQIKRYLTEAQGIDIQDHDSPIYKTSGLQYLLHIFEHSINFFQERIKKPKEGLNLHKSLTKRRNIDDIIRIFLVASGQQGEHRDLTKQACALLRIAAVFNFLERDGLGSARESAFKTLKRKLEGKFFSRTDYRGNQRKSRVFNKHGIEGEEEIDIAIHEFEYRKKDPYEIVAKLLDKTEARPSDILDQVGYRIVADTAFDAFQILRELFFAGDSIFHWSLIRKQHSEPKGLEDLSMEAMRDPKRAKAIFEELSHTEVDEDERGVGSNKASLKSFRSINIIHDVPIKLQDGTTILFPFEAQIVSKQAHTSNHAFAPHTKYKRARQKSVKTRTMGGNLATEFDKAKEAA